MPNVTLFGARGAGKTCYLYYNLLKLPDADLSELGADLHGPIQFSNVVQKRIDHLKWPIPTSDSSSDGTRTEVIVNFQEKGFFGGEVELVVPDRSGEVFLAFCEHNSADDRRRKQAGEPKREPQLFEQACNLLDGSNGIILVLDAERIFNLDSDAYLSRYNEFLSNAERLCGFNELNKCPLLVVLNKSDTCGKSMKKRFEEGDSVVRYLRTQGDRQGTSLVQTVKETFSKEQTIWTWHSSTGKVLKDDQPDYATFWKLDADMYTSSFRSFLRLVIGA